jgi:hypothetical protein
MGIAIIMAVMMASPLYFEHLWQKRWFKICWWLALLILFGEVMRLAHITGR